MELRFLVVTRKDPGTGIAHRGEPVLQYRTMSNPEEDGRYEPIWYEWTNVPTVEEAP